MNTKIRIAWLAAGAALLAITFASGVPVRAEDNWSMRGGAATMQSQDWKDMQARMQAMQAQMQQLRNTTDPAERQTLLDAHMKLMQEQMQSMRMMMAGGMMRMAGDAKGMGMASSDTAMHGQPGPRHQAVEDRLDMMQMMMEQMMGQMQMQRQSQAPRD